jgi:16S rRNA (uracil1498-N3)-methyltransferase
VRWKKILTESAQQSRRLRVPVLRDAATPGEAFRADTSELHLLLSERAGAKPMRELLEPVSPKVPKLSIAIGPEGGWTGAEFSAAAEHGFAEAALGINILRTETAVCAALAAAQYAFGTFRQAPGSPDTSVKSLQDEQISRATREKGTRESSNE